MVKVAPQLERTELYTDWYEFPYESLEPFDFPKDFNVWMRSPWGEEDYALPACVAYYDLPVFTTGYWVEWWSSVMVRYEASCFVSDKGYVEPIFLYTQKVQEDIENRVHPSIFEYWVENPWLTCTTGYYDWASNPDDCKYEWIVSERVPVGAATRVPAGKVLTVYIGLEVHLYAWGGRVEAMEGECHIWSPRYTCYLDPPYSP